MNSAPPPNHEIHSTLEKADQKVIAASQATGGDGVCEVAREHRRRERHIAQHRSSVRAVRIKLLEDNVPLCFLNRGTLTLPGTHSVLNKCLLNDYHLSWIKIVLELAKKDGKGLLGRAASAKPWKCEPAWFRVEWQAAVKAEDEWEGEWPGWPQRWAGTSQGRP